MRTILAAVQGQEPVIFGFGNIGGLGEALVAHWGAHGELLTD
jgi:hypothetical protein